MPPPRGVGNQRLADLYADLARTRGAHITRWSERLAALESPPASPNVVSQVLNRAKVHLARPFGSGAVAWAVRNNTADSIEAYTRVSKGGWPELTLDVARDLLAAVNAEKQRIDAFAADAAKGCELTAAPPTD